MKELEERMIELEIRFTHQANLIDEFNEVLVAYDRRLAQLEEENRRLREMMASLEPDLPESPDE